MSAETSAESKPAGFTAPDVPSEAVLNTCIKCGLCLPTCPTYQLTLDERSSPRGRIHLIKEVLEGNLPANDATFRAQMSECLGCRNCEPVCPSGVAFGQVLEDARTQIARNDATTFVGVARKLAYDLPLFDVRRLRALALLALWLETTGLRRLMRRAGIFQRLGLARLESLAPSPAGFPFVEHGETWAARKTAPETPARGNVALFVGCVMGAMFGDVHRATVRVLTRSRWNVEAPAHQGCCGALHLHAGFKDGARTLARRLIAAFERSDAQWIAVNAAGCGAAMKDYGHLLGGDPLWAARAAAFSARVRDASELLEIDLRGSSASTAPLRVAFQEPCHLVHAQRIRIEPLRAIDALPGVERVEMVESDRCCGSAGVYNLTHPDFADRLAERKIAAAVDAGADRIVTANPGCQIHLSAASMRCGGPPVQHLMQLVDETYKRIDGGARAEGDAPDNGHGLTPSKGLLLAIGAIVIATAIAWALRRKS